MMDIVIFGVGKSNENLILARKVNVVAYLDNDSNKIGTYFDGKPIFHPSAIASLKYDFILIASIYSTPMAAQLASMGIDPNCVLEANTSEGRADARRRGILAFTLWMRIKALMRRVLKSMRFALFSVLPIGSNYIVYTARYGEWYHDNPRHLYEYLLENASRKYKHVWIFKNGIDTCAVKRKPKVKTIIARRNSFFHELLLYNADYLITGWDSKRYWKTNKKTVAVQTWHALGAFKRMSIVDNLPRNRFDYVLCSHEKLREIYAEALVIDEDRVKAIGIPRTDELYNKSCHNYVRCDFLNRIKLDPKRKTLLYAPTFRDSTSFIPKFDVVKVLSSLGEEWQILIRLHRRVNSRIDLSDLNMPVRDVTDVDEVNPILIASDLLITDYSSICFDFALLERPMIFYAYDYSRYHDIRGFYFGYDDFVPGPIAKTEEELYGCLSNWQDVSERYRGKVKAFAEQYVQPFDGQACRNVMKLLNLAPTED